jgi:ATP-dependent helicase HrpA
VPPTFHLEFPPELPISARAAEIIAAIQAHPVVILAGETGSGKTTQIPKLCLAAGRGRHGRIACTQPRRVAALSLSRRVAEEMRVPWGREVGCKVRFSDHTTAATVVKFMTDGLLLAEAQADPRLSAYDTLVIDEAHERSLNIDFLLGHLRTLRGLRPDLRIVITSATIDTAVFSQAFGDAPVLVVEGRGFPVEVIYAPLDGSGGHGPGDPEGESEGEGSRAREGLGEGEAGRDGADRAEALHYVDGAVAQAERLVRAGGPGDLLVFMPSERDIRETCELLAGRLRDCEIIPLFGRLSNADQHRVFGGSRRRKIVVATNLAETSLTIPGIRFVVDTGLARISRYSPSARTRRLPIEPVAQANADQRKGRCGRVAAGVCVRLYSEEDYLARPRFAQPEIQRANLADVILRLQAGGLGQVETFPFLSPPAPKAIRAGYALLEELGALAERAAGSDGAGRPLTALGHELARLPVDPTVARMILQARTERAVREVLVIAAGLSIQDPRERPLARRAAADAAHRRFDHPDSDFLGLLNLWGAFHAEGEAMSQSRLRGFCRTHFLSYPRMREWRDVHLQLREVLQARGDFAESSVWDGLRPEAARTLAFGSPGYRAIHRSILAGLLGSIALRDEERGGYRATHDRQVVLFPGSVLARRRERPAAGDRAPAKPGRGPAGPKGEAAGPRWILAAEIVETARLYARTCARLDPAWVVDLGAHVTRVAHSEPFWDAVGGRVRVVRRTRLYGLEVERRSVSFGPIDPGAATEIFIREGLVGDTIPWPLDCLEHNRRVRARVETVLTRARDRSYLNLDEAMYRFYAARLRGISSVAELVDLVRERQGAEPDFLRLKPGDLRDPEAVEVAAADFPEALPLQNRAVPLHYAYRPGQDDDGATLAVHVRDWAALTPRALEWAVAGHLPAKVEHYLRALPKEQRKALAPLTERARTLAEAVVARDRATGRRESLTEALAAELAERHGLTVPAAFWAGHPPPDHLRVRIRVLDDTGAELAAGRDLAAVAEALAAKERAAAAAIAREEPGLWRSVRERWERPEQTSWTFGDVPERVALTARAGVEVWAHPGLRCGPSGVALHLFAAREEARAATAAGWPALLALELRRELAWLHRDLRLTGTLGAVAATLGPVDTLREEGYASIRSWLLGEAPPDALTAAAFGAARQRALDQLPGLAPRALQLWERVLALRQELLVEPKPYPGLAEDLAALMPPDFLRRTPFAQLSHLPRYLQAMKLRCERWSRDPAKDAERARQLAPLAAAAAQRGGEARWLAEELRVSLFAQELGTPVPISAIRLERWLRGEGAPAAVTDRTAPRLAAPVEAGPVAPAATPAAVRPPGSAPVKGGERLKSLGALDRIFPRQPG